MNGEAGQRWDPTTLGVACEINPPKPKLAGLPDDTPIMFVPMAAVDDVAGVVAAPEQRALGEVRSKSYRTFSSQDVIFAKITPCMENGKCSVVPDIPTGLGFGSTEFHVLRPRPGVNPRFIWYYVRQESFRRLAEDHMTGSVGQLRVPVSFLQDSPILLPPETVQNEIVRILDGATMSGRSASGHLATAQRAIERFRHVALAAAWREASEDAPAFRLEDLLEEPMRNGYSALPTNTVTPFRVLTLTATTSGWFEEHHFKYTAEEFTKDSPFWVRPADILVQRGNTAEYVGVPALYEGEGHQFLFPDLMIRVRVRPDVSARYVWYMLLSPQLRNLVRAQATGSAGNMPKINQKILSDVLIPLPDVQRRAEIVKRLDKSLNMAARIAQRIGVASRRVQHSNQAILAKAFRGELIPISDAMSEVA